MIIEQLVKTIDLVGDSPKTLQYIRKIIVGFAITGRLSPADDKRIVPAALATGQRKGSVNVDGRKAMPILDVSLHDLPNGFSKPESFVRLGSVARIEKGRTGIMGALPGPYSLVVTAADRLPCDHYDFEGAAAIVPLVSSTGHGKASLQRLHYQEGQFALGSILAAIFPHDPDEVSARFIYEYLTAFKEELLVSKMIGTANVSLSVKKVSEIPLPLVSRGVQRKVDQLMELCDRLEVMRVERESRRDHLTAACLIRLKKPTSDDFNSDLDFILEVLPSLTKRPDQVKQMRHSLLYLAVCGKLIPEDDAALLKEVELESLVKIVRGSSPRPKGDPRYYGGPVPRLLIADITRDGKHVTPRLDTLTVEGAKLSRPMPKGSLVLAISGSYGLPAFLAVDACIHDGFIGFRDISNDIDVEYLFLVLKFRKPYFDDVVKDSGLKNLTTEHLKRLIVPLYPIDVQRRIVAKVADLTALCDRLEASLRAGEERHSGLLSSMLGQAMLPIEEHDEAA